MRSNSILIIVGISLFSCKHDVSPVISFRPDYYAYPDSAIVNVNGINFIKYIKSRNENDTMLGMEMNSSVNNFALYYPLGITQIPMFSGQYIIHKFPPNDSILTAEYSEMCCYDNPDQFNKIYDVNEADSTQNYFLVNVNKSAKIFSAKFKIVLVNQFSPFDTIRIKCDTLFSRW